MATPISTSYSKTVFQLIVNDEIYDIEVVLKDTESMTVTATGINNKISYISQSERQCNRGFFIQHLTNNLHKFYGDIHGLAFYLRYDNYTSKMCLFKKIPDIQIMVDTEVYTIRTILHDDGFMTVEAVTGINKIVYSIHDKQICWTKFLEVMRGEKYTISAIIMDNAFKIEYHPDCTLMYLWSIDETILQPAINPPIEPPIQPITNPPIETTQPITFDLTIDKELYNMTVEFVDDKDVKITATGKTDGTIYYHEYNQMHCPYFLAILKKDKSQFTGKINGDLFIIMYNDSENKELPLYKRTILKPIIEFQNTQSLESKGEFYDIQISLIGDIVSIIVTDKVSKIKYVTKRANGLFFQASPVECYKLITLAFKKTNDNISYIFEKKADWATISIDWKFTEPIILDMNYNIALEKERQTDEERMKVMMDDLRRYMMEAEGQI